MPLAARWPPRGVRSRLADDARKAARSAFSFHQIEVDFRAVMDRARERVAQSKSELDASFANRDNVHLAQAIWRVSCNLDTDPLSAS